MIEIETNREDTAEETERVSEAEQAVEPEKTEEETAEAGSEEEAADDETAEEAEETEEPAAEEQSGEDEELNARYMRLMADFQNFKRRAEKQRLDGLAYANEQIVTDLLDVVDNFERALDHEVTDEELSRYKEGMEMIYVQLMTVLERFGLEEIEAQGIAFDPNFHNAVMTEATDKFDSGVVSEVLQKGYTLKGKVIRAAMVKVAE